MSTKLNNRFTPATPGKPVRIAETIEGRQLLGCPAPSEIFDAAVKAANGEDPDTYLRNATAGMSEATARARVRALLLPHLPAGFAFLVAAPGSTEAAPGAASRSMPSTRSVDFARKLIRLESLRGNTGTPGCAGLYERIAAEIAAELDQEREQIQQEHAGAELSLTWAASVLIAAGHAYADDEAEQSHDDNAADDDEADDDERGLDPHFRRNFGGRCG
ncbi:MAG: hypothetical protein AMXMBFR59_06880 [Rhodanobacteraceae bacterium]